jgi:hypothetical protein
MAKRATGIEKGKASRSKKTKKRLAAKKEMLAKKASKKRRKEHILAYKTHRAPNLGLCVF